MTHIDNNAIITVILPPRNFFCIIAGKAVKYYAKNTTKYYKNFLGEVPKDFLSAVGTNTISYYIKEQYNRIFGE